VAHKRLDIQGLRAVAILSVVAFHGDLHLSGGFTGVDIFFAVSGFVITSTLVRELERTGFINLAAFYRRRVKRLLPALAVVIVFVALVGSLATPAVATHMAGMTGVFASFFAANAYLYSLPTGYFRAPTQADPLLHTWTLAVEEQFYLVFPLLLLGAWRFALGRRLKNRWTAVCVIGVAFVGSLILAFTTTPIPGQGFGYYASPARAWEFAAGSLVALAAPIWRRLPRLVAMALAVVGLFGIGFALLTASTVAGLLLACVIPVSATCALLAAGAVANPVSRLLTVRPATWVGDLSYSWYLWHWPFIVFARALAPGSGIAVPVAAAISLAPAWVSYRFVENPVRFNPRIHGTRVLKLAAVCITVPAVISFGASRLHLTEFPAYVAGAHADLVNKCNTNALYDDPSRQKCTWRPARPYGSVVLIGDSNAGHFTEPFVSAANRAGFAATVATPSGCPFTQLRIWKATYDYRDCLRFNADALRRLLALRPNLVVISSRLDLYLRDSAFSFGGLGVSLTHDSDAKERLLVADLSREIRRLNDAGVPVVLLTPIPAMPTGHGVACAVILLLVDRCGGSVSRSQADHELAHARDVEREAAAGKRAWLVDFEDELCPDGRCASSRKNLILYRNEDHLSVTGARSLTRSFSANVISHARRPRPSGRLVLAASPR
jgi:peptidoglycan/LPS O-acetylase OafA/YrhL